MTQEVEANFSLPAEHQQMLTRFCQLMSPEDVQLYYQIVLTARKDLPYADDEQAAFDMMLLRLLAFKPIANSLNLPEATKATSHELLHKNINEPSLSMSTSLAHANASVNENLESIKIPTSSEQESLNTTNEIVLADSVQNETDINENQSDSAEKDQHHTNENQHEDMPNYETVIEADPDTNGMLTEEMLTIEHQAQTIMEQNSESKTLQLDHNSSDKNTIDKSNTTHDDKVVNPETSVSNNSSEQLQEKEQSKPFSSPVAAAIATRNMLRSRKKLLEDSGKKPNGAVVRPLLKKIEDTSVEAEKNTFAVQPNIPDLATLPEQPYSENVINPATIKLAKQVDKWAHMIDSMSLIARLRQLAIHATVDEASTDDVLILQLDQSIKHLNSDAAHKELEARISEYLQRKVTVELNIVEKTVSDPYQIQADINAKRYEYAKQVLAEDEIVIALQQQFQAELDQETIVAR
jgi:DNA polymerase-3 subunit gamma/tau